MEVVDRFDSGKALNRADSVTVAHENVSTTFVTSLFTSRVRQAKYNPNAV